MTKASSSVVSMRLSVIAIVISLVAMFGGIAAGLFGSVALRSVLNAPIRSQMFVVEDDAGRERIMFTAKGDGAPRLLLSDQNGTSRAELTLTPMGDPSLIMSSADGQSRLRVSLLGPQRQPEVLLLGQDGRSRWRVYLDENDTPVVANLTGND